MEKKSNTFNILTLLKSKLNFDNTNKYVIANVNIDILNILKKSLLFISTP